jgi:hypothetical protein
MLLSKLKRHCYCVYLRIIGGFKTIFFKENHLLTDCNYTCMYIHMRVFDCKFLSWPNFIINLRYPDTEQSTYLFVPSNVCMMPIYSCYPWNATLSANDENNDGRLAVEMSVHKLSSGHSSERLADTIYKTFGQHDVWTTRHVGSLKEAWPTSHNLETQKNCKGNTRHRAKHFLTVCRVSIKFIRLRNHYRFFLFLRVVVTFQNGLLK